ncbi:MAG: prepilin-type N-terminal cleavage/methylation domain-containing protein [Verrucomicrobiota bacterium]
MTLNSFHTDIVNTVNENGTVNDHSKLGKLSDRRQREAFTLVELMTVIAIGGILLALSSFAIVGINGGQSLNGSISDLKSTLENARAYAMANNTYVRVAIGEVQPPASKYTATIVMPIYSTDGTLDHDTAIDMEDTLKWAFLGKPVILKSLLLYDFDTAASASITTNEDAFPLDSNISKITGRKIPFIQDTTPRFDAFIQFNPAGEARVNTELPTRHIKLSFDQPDDQGHQRLNQNPFILRLSGMNGTVSVLRKENQI